MSEKNYREKTSALRTLPTMFPRWGTLFTYGNAEVIKTFRCPCSGRILSSEAMAGSRTASRTAAVYSFYNTTVSQHQLSPMCHIRGATKTPIGGQCAEWAEVNLKLKYVFPSR